MDNNKAFSIDQPFVTQEQKFKYWQESKAHIKALEAAQQQSAGEIAELTEKLERKKSYALAITEAIIEKDMTINVLKADNERLQIQVNELKILLNEARDDVAAQLDNYQQLLPYKQHRYDAQKIMLDSIDQALAKTPSQCLIEHDNEVIERCALALENAEGELKYLPEYVALLRKLKG